jgi:acetolactate synthase-1/2/3 large subunit
MVPQPESADRYLEGNAANTLRQLAKRAGELDEAAVAERRAAQEARFAAEQAAIAQAEAEATPQAEGVAPVLVAATLRTSAPDSYFYVQGGLGQGIAVALGVKLAARQRPVVLTIGDGAFAYNPVIPSYDASGG